MAYPYTSYNNTYPAADEEGYFGNGSSNSYDFDMVTGKRKQRTFGGGNADKANAGGSWLDDNLGGISSGIDMAKGAVGSWLGYQNLKLAKKDMALKQDAFAFNKEQATMEASLKLDAKKRGLAKHGVSSEVVDKYAAQYK